MYKFYKFFGKISKPLSNIALVITIPISIILFVFSILFVLAKEFLSSINLWTVFSQAFANENGLIEGPAWNAFRICQLVFLIIAIIIVVLWVLYITFFIIRKVLFKNIAGMLVARNKEYRNLDINAYQEKLERYRYRD